MRLTRSIKLTADLQEVDSVEAIKDASINCGESVVVEFDDLEVCMQSSQRSLCDVPQLVVTQVQCHQSTHVHETEVGNAA